LNQFVAYFANGIVALCYFVMHYVGIVDDALKRLGNQAGLDPQRQLYVLLVLIVVAVVLAMRTLGGFLGWIVLLLLLLLLLHRVVPGADTPAGMFGTPLQNVLK